jgi:hypothetical protein
VTIKVIVSWDVTSFKFQENVLSPHPYYPGYILYIIYFNVPSSASKQGRRDLTEISKKPVYLMRNRCILKKKLRKDQFDIRNCLTDGRNCCNLTQINRRVKISYRYFLTSAQNNADDQSCKINIYKRNKCWRCCL